MDGSLYSVPMTLSAIEGSGNCLANAEPLVHYDPPVLMRRANRAFTPSDEERDRVRAKPQRTVPGYRNSNPPRQHRPPSSQGKVSHSSARAKQLRSGGADRMKDILLAMLPNRQWVDDDGNLWVQTVQTHLTSRDELVHLKDRFNQRLEELQARPEGVDPVREQLASELFDEIIRQVTTESPERGLLLLRVRDELRMRLGVYLQLYATARIQSATNQQRAQETLRPNDTRLDELQKSIEKKKKKVNEMQGQIERIEQNSKACSQATAQIFKEELDKLRAQRKMIETYINTSKHRKDL